MNPLGIEGQDLGVQLIGLGQPADGFGKVAHVLGIGNDYGQAGLIQGVGHGILVAPGGFQQHDLGVEGLQMRRQGGNAVLVVGLGEGLADGHRVHVQTLRGYVDTDKGLRGFHVP